MLPSTREFTALLTVFVQELHFFIRVRKLRQGLAFAALTGATKYELFYQWEWYYFRGSGFSLGSRGGIICLPRVCIQRNKRVHLP